MMLPRRVLTSLTEREWAIVELLLKHQSAHEIAHALDISVHTARRHTERIMKKLNVSSRHRIHEAFGITCDCVHKQLQQLREQELPQTPPHTL